MTDASSEYLHLYQVAVHPILAMAPPRLFSELGTGPVHAELISPNMCYWRCTSSHNIRSSYRPHYRIATRGMKETLTIRYKKRAAIIMWSDTIVQ